MSLFLGSETHEQKVEIYLEQILETQRAALYLLRQIAGIDLTAQDLSTVAQQMAGGSN